MLKYNKGYDVYIEILDDNKNTINIIYKGVILNQYLGSKYKKWKHDYPLVFVPNHGETSVHRLVAFAYGIYIKNYEIDHIDNNPFNNHPSNLRAMRHEGNMKAKSYQQHKDKYNEWKEVWRNNNHTI